MAVTIEQAVKAKGTLEAGAFQLLREYECLTGLSVTGCTVLIDNRMSGEAVIVGVKMEVELP